MKAKYLVVLLMSVTLFGCGAPASEPAHISSEAIFLLLENGGSVPGENQAASINAANHLLQKLTKLDRHKASRNAQIYIVLSAKPNEIAWSGTPRQLLEQAADVKGLMDFTPSFSDLVMAFDEIKTTIDLTMPDKVRLYWIGPVIHVPFQDTNGQKLEIKVPQPIPEGLALTEISKRLSVLKIMGVHPDQEQVLTSYLAGLGVLQRARNREIDFALLGAAQTKSHLNDLM